MPNNTVNYRIDHLQPLKLLLGLNFLIWFAGAVKELGAGEPDGVRSLRLHFWRDGENAFRPRRRAGAVPRSLPCCVSHQLPQGHLHLHQVRAVIHMHPVKLFNSISFRKTSSTPSNKILKHDLHFLCSTTGKEVINKVALENRNAGLDREEIDLADLQEALVQTAFNNSTSKCLVIYVWNIQGFAEI